MLLTFVMKMSQQLGAGREASGHLPRCVLRAKAYCRCFGCFHYPGCYWTAVISHLYLALP